MPSRPTVLLTGAGGALAGAVVDRFTALGWRTALFHRSDASALGERHRDAAIYRVDLDDEAATRERLREAEAEAGGLDAVVNLAGGYERGLAVDLTLADMERSLARNLFTAVTTTTAALPGMLERGRGTIVGIAAGQAVDGGAGVAAYAASKAALVAYLRSVDRELAPQGVRTVVVYPMGTLDTAPNRAAMPAVDPGGWIATATLAEAIATAVTVGPRGRFVELRVFPDAH